MANNESPVKRPSVRNNMTPSEAQTLYSAGLKAKQKQLS